MRRLDEAEPGAAWRDHFERFWPAYDRWLASQGGERRPGLAASRARLRLTMPELGPIYGRLCELARQAGGDELAERFLTLYRPPPFLAGCSVLARGAEGGGEPLLVRNYDFDPELWEATVMATSWCGQRVLAMSDCLWGALDGMNEAGVAVALAFGGRQTTGDGFGIPLIVRYLLETCDSAAACREALAALPSHMAYNLTVVDSGGDAFTAHLTPGRAPRFVEATWSANHQDEIVWPEHAAATCSAEREAFLGELAAAGLPDDPAAPFLGPPLHAGAHERGFATLYTAVYRPRSGTLELRWPDRRTDLALGGESR